MKTNIVASELLTAVFRAPHHSLILISDPDQVLADEARLAELAAAGYRILAETDPVALRARYEAAKPITAERPLIVITPGPLDQLPYDLWQQGQHLTLALSDLFPNLDYPTLRTLSPGQRARLGQALAAGPAPGQPLSPSQTGDFLLRAVFAADPAALVQPAAFVLWLDAYHGHNDPMPPALAAHFLQRLRLAPGFAASPISSWPHADLLADAVTFREFVREGWDDYLARTYHEHGPGYRLSESPHPLDFAADPDLQDVLPRLIRSGVLLPTTVPTAEPLPAWILPAVAADPAGIRARRFAEGLAALREQMQAGDLRWEQWQTIALRWAQLLIWRHDIDLSLPAPLLASYDALQDEVDARFGVWLASAYTPLATRALPHPHHLYHVPRYLAQRARAAGRIALIVLDGMALADWLVIGDAWGERHPGWRFDEQLLLAQIPTITAVSRQALVSGLRPIAFAGSLAQNRREAEQWAAFWRGLGYPDAAIDLQTIPDRVDAALPAAIEDRRLRALCLISPVIDAMIHGSTQGAADLLGTLHTWLQEGAGWLEEIIKRLLAAGFTVFLASDHGHVAGVGFGQPQEGVLVETRGKRARIYDNADFAAAVHAHFPNTVLWRDDGLLPPDRWVLMPKGRQAFAPVGERVVSHGGLTLEEVVVPFVVITRAERLS